MTLKNKLMTITTLSVVATASFLTITNIMDVKAEAKNEITGGVAFGTISIADDDSVSITISSTNGTAQTITLNSGSSYDLDQMVSMINGVSDSTKVSQERLNWNKACSLHSRWQYIQS